VNDNFDFGNERAVPFAARVNGERQVFEVRFLDGNPSIGNGGATVDLIEVGDRIYALNNGRQVVVESEEAGIDIEHLDGDGAIKAPMHGKVLALFVSEGENVQKGHRLAVLEAMKMEHALLAPIDGRVSGLAVEAGAQVAEGAVLLNVVPA
jgi:3-methylcrotonyl-CoA carboxylase alpha subunit